MVEKISVKMVPHAFGVVKNIDKALLLSTDNGICGVLEDLSPNRRYDCIGSIHFNEINVGSQNLIIHTDYGGKCNAYFWFTFQIFLGTPTVKPIVEVSWG